ncbi:DUF3822 family protein [Mucilaginibacter sp. UR6-11]|uniref:DUF3822 family protein n=1 Tax=Mucilaginibacter sp. UR6-11 TaxID=1435644 RepID=UPI001E2C6BD8|nr:DUF3822 family protein [Mucilaginibacter sp. UR6-11]MCC8426020.1 DUF3822 family protein [Mucilaginibacter sp. UR6-11]
MSEQIYTFRDPSFNLNEAYYYTLLIQVDAMSFSYAITYKKQLLAWDANCNLAELSDPQELANELTATYKKVIIGLPANGFTLVPAPLFSKNQAANYARLLDVKPDEKVFAQPLDTQNFIIYKVDEKIVSAVEKFDLDNAVYIGKGWITAAAENNPTGEDIYLHTENGRAEFLCLKNGTIRFYNSFEFQNEDDLAYYAALVVQELGLYPYNVHLKLSGSVKPEDKFSIRLTEFFPNVTFFNPQLLELPEQINSQQVLTLAALSLCESSEVL